MSDITNDKLLSFGTGSMRECLGQLKGRMDLLPWAALIRVSKHLQKSTAPVGKYPVDNWKLGQPMHQYMDSAVRHIGQYMEGDTDEDHLAAAASNLLMALWTEEKLPDMQDIQSRYKGVTPDGVHGR